MNKAANTVPKALRQLDLGIETCEQAEAETVDAQLELGDSLRDLRIAAMIPRKAIAQHLRIEYVKLAAIERSANSDIAKKYRATVVILSERGFGQ